MMSFESMREFPMWNNKKITSIMMWDILDVSQNNNSYNSQVIVRISNNTFEKTYIVSKGDGCDMKVTAY